MKKKTTNKNPVLIKKVFETMLILFLLLLTFFIVPDDLGRTPFIIYAILSLVFLILGIFLIVLALRSDEKKIMKIFLVMMGGSAGGVLLGSVLHNMFYAFAMMSEGITVLVYLFEGLHVAFFLISLIGCPLAFLVGALGAIWLWVRKK